MDALLWQEAGLGLTVQLFWQNMHKADPIPGQSSHAGAAAQLQAEAVQDANMSNFISCVMK